MLLKHRLSLGQIFSFTWKVDLMLLGCCTLVYFLDSRWLAAHINIPIAVSTVLGTAIAFFIGFNNNQAYDRWWEARKIWGALVNDSRTWSRSMLNYPSPDATPETKALVRHMIYRHLAFIYALKTVLRKRPDDYYTRYLTTEEIEEVQKQSNIPNAILNLQTRDLQQLRNSGSIDGFTFIELNQILVKHCDSMGQSERIRNTVFPPSYVYFTQMFIWFYVIMNTLMMTESIGAWAIPFGWMFGFVFHVTHLNGITLMDPFDFQPLAIPLDSIARTIEINVIQLLGDEPVPAPVLPRQEGLYVM
ncbi:putative membrane protein [Chitinophaga ginsengisegetis]|uniref:Putative membrane protein n=1 Tax=Chitinophaga ginsengisegetis TaxID=393003 RepID=A0A1T5NR07_9BACT|nr:bestrophin family ion channel [Chitinophaga ginsengisegetis]MDR6565780.1 putative membrane protein [Chitinophaga ginsengisegetis]MDR6645509.1 putative membrane protein [Chitinophaga ginsengisegetis]MDR6651899.1 putative membrane protein [Chitinophaga ginsengisegetis]SKD02673.1 putative membrane protein [Chitinophaga ginsengisegetis]